MNNPHEVFVFTCEEILLDLFGEDLTKTDLNEVRTTFVKWVAAHNVLFYIGSPESHDDLYKAILVAVAERKRIVVMSESYTDALDDKEEDDPQ